MSDFVAELQRYRTIFGLHETFLILFADTGDWVEFISKTIEDEDNAQDS